MTDFESYGVQRKTYDRVRWLRDSHGYAVQIEWYGKRKVYCGYTITEGGGNGMLVASASTLRELQEKLKGCWEKQIGYEKDEVARSIRSRQHSHRRGR